MALVPDRCPACGNRSLTRLSVAGTAIDECEMCGEIYGPADVIELLELQREAENLDCSQDSYPLARFVQDLPGVKVLVDSGGDEKTGKSPFISFELTDKRTTQLENLGQALRLLRDTLECRWVIEFSMEFQPTYELHAVNDNHTPADFVEAARRDMAVIWRGLRQYSGLGWWRAGSGRQAATKKK